MFSCTARGKHMSDEIIKEIGRFIRRNREDVYEVNIYGGEPFINIDHFKKCFDEFYDNDMSFHISSNGSFLTDRKKRLYVWELCNKFKANTDDMGGKIRISNTKFHDACRTDKMKMKFKKLEWVIKEPCSWENEYAEDYDYEDENDFQDNPDYPENPLVGSSQEFAPIYIDEYTDEDGVNPSGRALKTDTFTRYDKRCHCIATSSLTFYESFDEAFEDCCTVNINHKGMVGMCCTCDSGTVGHISEFHDFDDIKKAIFKFRSQIREKYNWGSDTKMIDACQLCKKFKMKG